MADRGKLFWAIQHHFRMKRIRLLSDLIRSHALSSNGRKVRILDAGGRPNYWQRLPEDLHDRVEIIIQNYDRELTLYDGVPSRIQTEYVLGDACNMPEYEDEAFDIVHSNSVIEHVGSYSNMVRFASETRRVGRSYLIQTPSFWFPYEPHIGLPFVHWLPSSWVMKRISTKGLGYWEADDLLTVAGRIDHLCMIDNRFMRMLYPDGTLYRERFCGVTKSVTYVRWAAAQ